MLPSEQGEVEPEEVEGVPVDPVDPGVAEHQRVVAMIVAVAVQEQHHPVDDLIKVTIRAELPPIHTIRKMMATTMMMMTMLDLRDGQPGMER